MSAFAGTRTLLGLALRRDRIVLPAWVGGTVLLVLASASSLKTLYAGQAERAALGASVDRNGSLRALTGPLFDHTSIGGLTAWRIGGYAALVAGLMSLLLVVRHTRAEEEAGRVELVGAGAVGRYAVPAAALLLAGLADLAIAALLTVGLVGLGLPATGSVALGLATAATGLVFAAAAALTAQLSSVPRAASGIAGALLGLAYLVRAVGDLGDGTLSWLSPIGWAQQVRPYADERWAVLLLPMAPTAVLLAAATALVPRRDLGAGLLPPRPGPESGRIGSPLALAWRLQRGAVLGWGVGVAVAGAVIGSVAADVGDVVTEGSGASDLLHRITGQPDLVEAYLVSVLGVIALVSSGFVVQSVLRVRAEETSLRAEPVLAGAVPRWRWAGAHVLVAAAGSAGLVLLSAGLMGLVHGARTGDVGGQVGSLLGAGLVQVPAVWVLGALAVAVTGVLPRLAVASWAALAVCAALMELSGLLDLPGWLLDLSPFRHVPQLPAADLRVLPLVLLLAVAAALAGTGFAGLRRRDIG